MFMVCFHYFSRFRDALVFDRVGQVHVEQEALLEASFASKARSAQRALTERLRAQRYVP